MSVPVGFTASGSLLAAAAPSPLCSVGVLRVKGAPVSAQGLPSSATSLLGTLLQTYKFLSRDIRKSQLNPASAILQALIFPQTKPSLPSHNYSHQTVW